MPILDPSWDKLSEHWDTYWMDPGMVLGLLQDGTGSMAVSRVKAEIHSPQQVEEGEERRHPGNGGGGGSSSD